MKIKKQHRLLSLVFSLALVISALGTGVPTSAEGEVTTPITTISWRLWSNVSETDFSNHVPGTNNLNGQFCDVNFIENGEPSEASSNFSDWSAGFWFNAKVADRDAVLAPASGTTITADKTDGQTSNYWRLRFKINGVLNNPQSFVFYPHKSNITEIPNHYEVFVSDKQDGDGSTKIIDIYNTTDRAGDVIDVSGLNLTAIRYVEIRFYDTGRDNWNQAITEIGFFGGTIAEDKTITAHTSFANKTGAQNAVTAAGTNHLSGQNYEDSTFHNGANLEQTETIKADKIANSTFFNSIIDDSNIGAWHTHSCESSRASTDIFQTSDYREMVIGLSEAVNNPEKFVFSFHPGGGLPSRHYSVYMSDKRDTLFDDVSKVIEITDSKARVGDLIDLTGLNIKKVRYVGIRIYSFGMTYENGCKIQHISEIGLYGGLVIGPMGDMNMDTKVDILDLVRLKRYNADSTVAIDADNELLVDFEGSSAQLAALRMYLLTGSWHMPTLFADEGYTYVWGDEFNAQTLNSDKWENGDDKSDSDIIRSNETNLSLANGSLNLKVNGVTNEDGTTTYYTSEGLRTHSTMNFQYGYLEMKIKAPVQSGVWPGFWLSGLNGPYSDVFKTSLTRDTDFTDYGTEIDILEQYRTTDEFYTSLHKWYPGAKNALKYNKCTYKFDGEYHIYGFKWTHDEMSVYVDGAKCYSYDLSENFDKTGYNTTMDGFRSPHYFRITNGLDKAATGYDTPLTADVDCTLSVDWIRLYQIPGVGGLWTK